MKLRKSILIILIIVLLGVSVFLWIYFKPDQQHYWDKVSEVDPKMHQSICDVTKFGIERDPYTNYNSGDEIPDEIKEMVTNIVKDLSGYKKFHKKYPGSLDSVTSMSLFPFTYLSSPSRSERTPLIPIDIISQSKEDSIIVRYFVSPPGSWIPESMPSYNVYIDICSLVAYEN